MNEIRFISASPDATYAFAARLLARLAPGAVLALHGNLGAGKTCFVQGLARALDVRTPVNSPTFTLVNEYKGRLPLYHIDFYRLHQPEEALALGLEEYLQTDGITAIEWAERVAPLLPDHAWHLFFAPGAAPEERVITCQNAALDLRGLA